MKHLLKKLSIAGAGGKGSKPKPPIYKPPVMGELQYGASHSYAETLDLLSDGPIEGIVNSHGELVDGLNILQGIYLDDTPVAVTSKSAKRTNSLTSLEIDTINSLNLELDNPVAATYLSKFFQELGKVTDRSEDGKITSLESDTSGGIELFEDPSFPDVVMVFLRSQFKELRGFRSPNANSNPKALPLEKENYALFIRGFIQYRGPSSAQTFPWYLNRELQTDYDDSNAAYRNNKQPKGTVQNSSLIWGDTTTLESSKFLFSLSPYDSTEWTRDATRDVSPRRPGITVFSDNVAVLNELIQEDLKLILDLYTGGEGIETNKWQKELANRALKNMGWNEGDVSTLLFNHLKETSGGVAICKVSSLSNPALVNKQILDGEALMGMETLPYGTTSGFDLIAVMENSGITITDVTCPKISDAGVLDGEMHGFLIFEFPLENNSSWNYYKTTDNDIKRAYGLNQAFTIPSDIINALKDLSSFKYAKRNNSISVGRLKFNYSNILAEIRKGEESQSPFNDFKKIFIDHQYGRELFGPFGVGVANGYVYNYDPLYNYHLQVNAPQRIINNKDMLTRDSVIGQSASNFNTQLNLNGLPYKEGSDDARSMANPDRNSLYVNARRNYSSWAESSLANFDEKPIPVVHIVYNPNVEEVFITLDISSLKDTLIKKVPNVRDRVGEKAKDLDIGTTFPAVLNISVETGSIGNKSNCSDGQIPFKTYVFRVVALIEGNTLIDIGNPDYKSLSSREFVIALNSADEDFNSLSRPFKLPPNGTHQKSILSDNGEQAIETSTIDATQTQNRYVKVTKLSYETNSVLLDKVVSVSKVTEIINANLPYPFSAIVGTKLDSRSFSSIPKRSYDCKLKKVKIPNNYFPSNNGIDKRYYDTEEEFNDASQRNKLIYKGDWNGLFHDTLQWTDNPAWILYDLLTNSRYGMGSHINVDQINKWQLYKIGRFCDNVDNEGYFLGVTDGRGGKEPRFSCNIVFDQGQKIFDAINTIASLFRGRTFFSNSEINFVDDRPRNAINLFTNESVKDGLFYYSNNRRDEQFNTIEIGYKDRFNQYEPKIEIVEDEEDIKERGIFKKRIDGVGITSRAMARRAAEHQIFSKIKENQQVAFTAGLETLLCKPGDLVVIEDELKTNITNFGKVLDVNLEDETIRLSNNFSSTMTTGVLTVYNPTGIDSTDELDNIADTIRQRYDGFTITGLASDSWHPFTGDYSFSSYTEGYTPLTEWDTRYSNYASYTGISGTNVYFETGVTGWVLGSGDAMSLYSGDFIAELTGAQSLLSFNTGKIAVLDMASSDKRGAVTPFSGFDLSSFRNYSRGITNQELSAIAPEQITEISVTGIVTNLEYGCLVSGFDRPEILPLVQLGSAAKFQIKDATPFFYKVISMKEENPNEYLVTATKYDTGKFSLIDENISIEDEANTYSYQVAQTINGVTYQTLDPPTFVGNVTTGIPNATDQTFNITANWTTVADVTGYGVRLTMPNGQEIYTSTDENTTNISLDGLNQVGVFNVGVNALGDMGSAGGDAYYDSPYRNTGIFVLYEDALTYSKSFLNKITIL
jgi:hypothetical protein